MALAEQVCLGIFIHVRGSDPCSTGESWSLRVGEALTGLPSLTSSNLLIMQIAWELTKIDSSLGH